MARAVVEDEIGDSGSLALELGSAEVLAMTNTSRTVEQTNHRLIRDALRETLRAGPGALERVGSLRYRASAVLYLLLLEHPIDGRGRCWSCPGVLSGLRPRPCQIHLKASDWLLHHPDEVLRSHLARQFGREFGTVSLLSHRTTGTPAPIRPDRESPPRSLRHRRATRSHGPTAP
jgi:hypothetical protein